MDALSFFDTNDEMLYHTRVPRGLGISRAVAGPRLPILGILTWGSLPYSLRDDITDDWVFWRVAYPSWVEIRLSSVQGHGPATIGSFAWAQWPPNLCAPRHRRGLLSENARAFR